MYIENIFYANIGAIRDVVGTVLAAGGIFGMGTLALAWICEAFGITAK